MIAVVVIVAAVAVAVAVLAALGGVAAEASFPGYFSAAKTCLDKYIVRSEGVLVFVVVELGFEVASEFVTEVEPERGPVPGAMTADSVTADIEVVVSGAEVEVFG